jgi:hypothetical protein
VMLSYRKQSRNTMTVSPQGAGNLFHLISSHR